MLEQSSTQSPPLSFSPMPIPYFQQTPNPYKRGGKIIRHLKKDSIPKMRGGGLRRLGKFVERTVRQVTRHPGQILPHAGAIIGNIIGGPIGGTIGGTIGGGLSGRRDASGHRNFLSNALRGAGTGALTSGVIGLGNMAMGSPFSAPLLSSSATPGFSGNVNPVESGTSSGIFDKLKNMVGLAGSKGENANPQSGGILGNLTSGNLLNLALLGTALGGTLGRKVKREYEEPIANPPSHLKSYTPWIEPKAHSFRRRHVPHEDNDEENLYFEDINAPPEYAEGGHVLDEEPESGFIEGDTGGQDDKVKTKIKPNSFIIPATVVSSIGDFNSDAGAKKLHTLVEHLIHKSKMNGYSEGGSTKEVPVYLSHGEYYIEPEAVTAAGNGDNHKGSLIFERFIKKELARTGLKRVPKKSKNIIQNLRGV